MMQQFTRILVGGMLFIMVGTTYMASSQGWWMNTIRNPQIMAEERKLQEEYLQNGNFNNGRSRLGTGSSTRREFRSGTRSSRGK